MCRFSAQGTPLSEMRKMAGELIWRINTSEIGYYFETTTFISIISMQYPTKSSFFQQTTYIEQPTLQFHHEYHQMSVLNATMPPQRNPQKLHTKQVLKS